MANESVTFSQEEINNEEWRPVNLFHGFEKFYEVSSLGRVRRISAALGTYIGRILKPRTGKHGYQYVVLTNRKERKTAKVHRLVAFAFLGNPPKGTIAAHNDGVKSNCKENNLRWATQKENHDDRKKHGTYWIAENHPRARLTNKQVKEIRNLIKIGMQQTEIAKLFGVPPYTIWAINSGQNWSSIV